MTTHLETPSIHLWTDENLPALFISPGPSLSASEFAGMSKTFSLALKKLRSSYGSFHFIVVNLEKVKWGREILMQFLEITVAPVIHLGQVHTFFVRPSDNASRNVLVDALLTVPNLNLHVHNRVEEILIQINYIKTLTPDGKKLNSAPQTSLVARIKNLVRSI